MNEFETQIRVRYAETDQMGYVYYGNYAMYFEVARVEALRSLGVSYKDLEENDILLPVTDFSIKYHFAAKYDDLLTIKTVISSVSPIRINFKYRTLCGDKQLNEAETTLVFVSKINRKITKAPNDLMERLKNVSY